MCGIAGFYTSQKLDRDGVLVDMASQIKHRGPDGSDIWYEDGVGFCHTRLAIVDLSVAGKQPMTSMDGRYTVTFNGEIYNFAEIKIKLKSYQYKWKGNSDTEVLLAAIQCWGIEVALKELSGMFAFALYDNVKKNITLVRDRFGEKPLYYYFDGFELVFSSELRPIYKFPGLRFTISRNSLSLYMKHGNVPAPLTIYDDVYKVCPGEVVSFSCKDGKLNKSLYWTLPDAYGNALKNSGNSKKLIKDLDVLLNEVVEKQMCSDVPLGAFLSGGVDSTTVASIMQSQSSSKIKTFSIGFEDARYDESVHAAQVADYLKTDHYNLTVGSKQLLDVVPMIPYIYDEPFSDSSQIPTYLVSRLAREHVTVALTGDGGDEVFGGYDRYKTASSVWNKLDCFSPGFREFLSSIAMKTPYSICKALSSPVSLLRGEAISIDKALKFATVSGSKTRSDFYIDAFLSHDHDVLSWVKDSGLNKFHSKIEVNNQFSFLKEMMMLDQMIYLPNDNLVKVDRAAMSVSLETRCPFLDPRLTTFSAGLDDHFKINSKGVGKWVLRQVLYKYVPEELVEKPKKGFSVPLAEWLRGPLREWADCLLEYNGLSDDGLFDADLVTKRWREHLSGKRNWQNQIWDVLVFQSWLKNNRDVISI